MYTEIQDISHCIEQLLFDTQTMPIFDDVARLSQSYGWEVTLLPGGHKRIITDMETTSGLATVIPNSVQDIYQDTCADHLPPTKSNTSSLPLKQCLPLNYYVPDILRSCVLSEQNDSCPCLFTVIMSPQILQSFTNHPQFGALYASTSSCAHYPQGLFTSPPPNEFCMKHYSSRFTDYSFSSLYCSLLRTVRLIDTNQLNQAYVGIGVTISKALSLGLHKSATYQHHVHKAECEIERRLFWAIWLLDTQMPLLQQRRTSFRLKDISVEKPSVCDGMAIQDVHHTYCLSSLIETRWLREQIQEKLNTGDLTKKTETLNQITDAMRQLRRFYDALDDQVKIHTLWHRKSTEWYHRYQCIVLLEHAFNWMLLFDHFLPARHETGLAFPYNLALQFCRQAADLITLVFERWIFTQYDCQSRMFLSHLGNAIQMHRYILQCRGASVTHCRKAYASLRFLHTLIKSTDLCTFVPAQSMLQLVSDLLSKEEWQCNSNEGMETDSILRRYYSGWKPSDDPLPKDENGLHMLDSEATTLRTISDAWLAPR
ncbi:uncharacterized protein BYT42DRAFT_387647 [Radiomyces spectabilis]|uniref:uncharacterized protein n=1 Tax=Radiomyces spectabilis TaxID=64574 RepID=UPI0022201C3F|nr:uncharacterized protein BYT42DRAFT_387647 [Radiomyces spectabilis]KAI8376466.1 hypothetical protein BYT42DRAFT_387647 [Radiomyces spectabilis]